MISLTESETFYELMFIVDGPNDSLATVEEVFQKIKKDRQPLHHLQWILLLTPSRFGRSQSDGRDLDDSMKLDSVIYNTIKRIIFSS